MCEHPASPGGAGTVCIDMDKENGTYARLWKNGSTWEMCTMDVGDILYFRVTHCPWCGRELKGEEG